MRLGTLKKWELFVFNIVCVCVCMCEVAYLLPGQLKMAISLTTPAVYFRVT